MEPYHIQTQVMEFNPKNDWTGFQPRVVVNAHSDSLEIVAPPKKVYLNL